jgi:hypothetical protein
LPYLVRLAKTSVLRWREYRTKVLDESSAGYGGAESESPCICGI